MKRRKMKLAGISKKKLRRREYIAKKWWIIAELVPTATRDCFCSWVPPEDALGIAARASGQDGLLAKSWKQLELMVAVKTGNTWEEFLREENKKKEVIVWARDIASI